MFGIAKRSLTPAEESFIEHRNAGAGRDGVEAVGDGRLARALQWMLLEFSRHDELARRIDIGELAAAAVGTAVCEDNRDAPLTADTQVRLPSRLAVVIGVSPPALDLVRSERRKTRSGGAITSVAMIVPPPPSATARGTLHFDAVGILKSVFDWVVILFPQRRVLVNV